MHKSLRCVYVLVINLIQTQVFKFILFVSLIGDGNVVGEVVKRLKLSHMRKMRCQL